MTCQELERFLYPYLDGEFEPEERLEVDAHLSQCPDCARRVHEEARLRQALRHAARQAVHTTRAPDSLRARLQGGLRQEQQRQARQRVWMQVGAAAAVLLMAGGAWVTLEARQHRRIMDDAARRHALQWPVEVKGGHAGVEQWFAGKLDHRVPVPELHDAVLHGGRISNVLERQAAYISYERAPQAEGAPARRIGLFVFNDQQGEVEAPALPAVQMGSSHGFNVAVWRDEEIVYELVTDLDESDIRRMLAEQGRQAGGKLSQPAAVDMPARPVAHQP